MAKQSLTHLLEKIGQEIHDRAFVDLDGNFRPITKDEQLARQIWKRALGYEEETANEDGTVVHRRYDPDPKMQQFLIERREGKIVTPPDKETTTLLKKITDLAKSQLNTAAEQSIDDRDNTQSET